MPSHVTVRAVEQDEIIDLGGNGPLVGASGEVLLSIEGLEHQHMFVLLADDAREVGKMLITEGWEALRRKHGAVGAIRHALGKGEDTK